MNEFRKNIEGLFVCEECKKTFVYKKTLSYHVNKIHNFKQYYDKWLKEDDEGICKICGQKTEFLNFNYGYKLGCCRKHIDLNAYNIRSISLIQIYGVKNQWERKEIHEKTKQNRLEKYGVEYNWQREDVIDQIKMTKKEKYDDENYNNQLKNKQTKLQKYGDENYHNIEKGKQTMLKKYGVEYPLQSKKIQEKTKQTCLEKYGVENPAQNKEIYEKGQKTKLEIHKFRDTNIWYQGSYELDFLEKYFSKYSDIKRGPSIKYIINGKNKVYHPDFYIPSLNLIIEIKSSWTLKLDENIKIKKKTTIVNGFKYIVVINKNYNKLNGFISAL